MTETNEQEEKGKKKPLSLRRPGRLELKKTVKVGQVRQSFSHGRTKAVTVEVRKKRTFSKDSQGNLTEVTQLPEGEEAPEMTEEEAALSGAKLTETERQARARALQGATLSEDAAGGEAEIEEATPEGVSETPPEEDAKAAPGTAEPSPASPEAPAGDKAARPGRKKEVTKARAVEEGDESDALSAAATRLREKESTTKRKPEAKRLPPVRRSEPRRRAGKLTINEALNEEERVRSLASVRRARERDKRKEEQEATESGKIVRDVIIPETITVQELSNRMAERGVDVIKVLMKMGVMGNITQVIDADTAELVVAEFGHKVKRVSEADVEIGLKTEPDDEASLKRRAPVVTIMGHVDHGKTSLLDALRKTDVVSREAGGITQHIGAYRVTLQNGDGITFLDTPGHEAFSAMRSRGAKVTDIVVLVVAADDGIMPQTIEAVHHAKAANVPVIVAINKMDKPEANPDRVRTELLQHDIVVESMGGDVLAIEVSAKAGQNLDKLEEAILLQAEILDLKANPDRTAQGIVVEAKLERGRGAVGTLLIQRGTLHVGDVFVAGSEWGRIRALVNDKGQTVEAVGPSEPAEILGLNGVPMAGDEFIVVDSEAQAREIAEYRSRREHAIATAAKPRGTLEQMLSDIKSGAVKELPVIIKGDVQGSVEAIAGSLEKLSAESEEVSVVVLHTAVGGINESDVTLAKASNALIIGFNVRANPQAREFAKREKIDIRYYSVIYDVTNDVKAGLEGMLSPIRREKYLGNAEIREVFNISKVGKVAGCMVTDGMVRRGAGVRLLRDSVVVHEGKLSSLKRFKDEVKEVRDGNDCGMAFENYQDIQAGDVIECFEVEETAATL
ncbi:MAG: translation initiation factor IF-2 [Alphaproteobacteria bacterium]|nr:translation initiation factor IF-2 [Alphaproteobacteria bacterium]